MASRTKVAVASLFLTSAPCLAVGLSPRGGLAHRVSCVAAFDESFTLYRSSSKPLIVSSALVLERDAPQPQECPGLQLATQVRPRTNKKADVILPVRNDSTVDAHVTVGLRVNNSTTNVSIGLVRSGTTVSKTIPIQISLGETNLDARLIEGP
jgi:hypothetical protein